MKTNKGAIFLLGIFVLSMLFQDVNNIKAASFPVNQIKVATAESLE